jgi:hypothetical protein
MMRSRVIRSIAKFLSVSVLLCVGLLAGGCTAGNIIDASGKQWIPPATASVSFVRQSTGDTYTVQTGNKQGGTSFSFDPYAAASSTNNPVILPEDDYTIIVKSGSSTWLTEGFTVHVNNSQACPAPDGNTGRTGIDCALFTLQLHPCGTALFDGPSAGVVPLTQMNCSWPQTVSTCPGGASAAQHVAIDCSTLTDPISIANCRPYARQVACEVAPEYVQLTTVALQTRCPTMTYTIIQNSASIPGAPNAGGLYLGGTCSMWYHETYSVNPGSPGSTLGYSERYTQFFIDPHEILHAFHESVTPKLDSSVDHPFFGTSMLELQRKLGLVTDADALSSAQSSLNQGLAIPSCIGAEETVAWGMYVPWLQAGGQDPNIVESVYSNIVLLNAANPTWSGAQLYHHALINVSPDPKAKQVLMAKGCAL